MKFRRQLVSLLIFNLLCVFNLSAQVDLELPQGTGTLPDITQGAKNGVIIKGEHVELYKQIVPEELKPLLDSNELIFEAAQRTRVRNYLDPSWSKNKVTPSTLTTDNALSPDFRFEKGYPFGDANELRSIVDEKTLGSKILWGTYAVEWAMRSFTADLSIRLIRSNATTRTMQAVFSRIFTGAMGSKFPVPQLFRERFLIKSPQVLAGLSWLTIRQLGRREDGVWEYLPSLQKVVRLTGSNRSDPLFAGGPSAEDLNVWSGKVENADIISAQEMIKFVPFVKVELPALINSGDSCRITSKSLATSWNAESHRFAGAGGWVPTDNLWAPRKVWRVEFTSIDVFSQYGRQTVYIDQETMLPVYKIGYDRSGNLMRIVIGTIGSLGEAANGFPILTSVVILDKISGTAIMLDTAKLTICSQYQADLTVAAFDPSMIGPPQSTQDQKDSVESDKSADPVNKNDTDGVQD